MLLNLLPLAFLLARDVDSGDGNRGASLSPADDVIAEIEADFGLGLSASDPFKEVEKELKSSILRDPF